MWIKLHQQEEKKTTEVESALLEEVKFLKERIKRLEKSSSSVPSPAIPMTPVATHLHLPSPTPFVVPPSSVPVSVASQQFSLPPIRPFLNESLNVKGSQTTNNHNLDLYGLYRNQQPLDVIASNERMNRAEFNPEISIAKEFSRLIRRGNNYRTKYCDPLSYMGTITNDKVLDAAFVRLIHKFQFVQKGKLQERFRSHLEREFERKHVKLSFVLNVQNRDETDLVKQVEKLLPSRKIIDLYLERYADCLYYNYPIIDMVLFKEKLDIILGTEDQVKIEIPSNNVNLDLCAILANLLIIMRISYMTIPPKDDISSSSSKQAVSEADDPDTLDSLREQAIGSTYVELARECLSNYKFRRTSLDVIQSLTFLRIYVMLAPEDGDGCDGSDSQTLMGVITRMAVGYGLHRDPDNFQYIKSERIKHIRRKLWHQIIFFDALQAIRLGSLLCFETEDYCDTCLPKLSPPYVNDNSEIFVLKSYNMRYEYYEILRETARVLLRMKNPPTKTDIEAQLGKLKRFHDCYIHFHGALYDFKENDSTCTLGRKAGELISSLTIKTLIASVHYLVFLNSEKNLKDYDIKHFQDALTLSLEISEIVNTNLKNENGYIPHFIEFLIIPTLLISAHRVLLFFATLIMRYLTKTGPFVPLQREGCIGNGSFLELDINEYNLICEHYRELVGTIKTISSKYVHAWKLIVSFESMITEINDNAKDAGMPPIMTLPSTHWTLTEPNNAQCCKKLNKIADFTSDKNENDNDVHQLSPEPITGNAISDSSYVSVHNHDELYPFNFGNNGGSLWLDPFNYDVNIYDDSKEFGLDEGIGTFISQQQSW